LIDLISNKNQVLSTILIDQNRFDKDLYQTIEQEG